ncbi:MAG: 4Fe-4S dicluster domain-containing protein [Candidatus Rokubacteria bacterium]|nr:4Fe-4S dicluster domain-containing protein [Candidatus Rokubacteria bacterium]
MSEGAMASATRLTPDELHGWLAGMLGDKRVLAAVDEDGLRVFRSVERADQIALPTGKTRWSPKEFLFARTETLFAYSVAGNEVTLDGAPVESAEQVLVGVRPCDAAGFLRLDAIFLDGDADSLYASHRVRTTVVTVACDEAGPECFCTAVGGSPASDKGSDVHLTRVADGWLVRPVTAKGDRLTASLAGVGRAPSPEEHAEAETQSTRVAGHIRQSAIAREWAAILESRFHLPLWETLGRRCVGCGICTYVCPSCSCFDVTDTGSASCGERCRSWDSCTFAAFTRHASGHNPRATQAARYRQRVLHKFSYFPLGHDGESMCVGCGRCVQLCPVGLNVRETVQAVVAAAADGHDAGG